MRFVLSIAILFMLVNAQNQIYGAATSTKTLAFFFGGTATPGDYAVTASSKVEIFNFVTRNWTRQIPPVNPIPRYYASAASVRHLAVFAGGANTSAYNRIDIYNTQNGVWTVDTLSGGRSAMSAVTVGDRIIFAGGYLSNISATTNLIEYYNPLTRERITSSKQLSQARAGMASTSNGSIALFVGGHDGIRIPYNNIDIFHEPDTWTSVTLTETKTYLGATSVGDWAIFAGGTIESSLVTTSVDWYQYSNGRWHRDLNLLSQPIWRVAATTVRNLAIFGGSTAYRADINHVNIYNDYTKSWEVRPFTGATTDTVPAATTIGNLAIFTTGMIYSFLPQAEVTANTNVSIRCPDGYAFTLDLLDCQVCSPGEFSNGTSRSCSPCPANTSSNTASIRCTPCPPGQYSDVGSASCSVILTSSSNPTTSVTTVETSSDPLTSATTLTSSSTSHTTTSVTTLTSSSNPITAETRTFSNPISKDTNINSSNSNSTTIIASVVSVGMLGFFLGIIIVFLVRRRRKNAPLQEDKPSSSLGSQYISIETGIEGFETKLDEGATGIVYRAKWKGQVVAIKQLKMEKASKEQITAFHKEYELMKGMEPHPNVLRLYTIIERPLSIIMEYCHKGSLQRLLESSTLISLQQMMSFMHQIAQGMNQLSKQNIIHRDLATRNCLLRDDDTVVVADFGLSRMVPKSDPIYSAIRQPEQGWPLKWMSPEALLFNFSEKSDVFSFGVTCVEIITRQPPYPHLTVSQFQTELFVNCSDPLPTLLDNHPDTTPQQIIDLINNCTNRNPADRPSFAVICDLLSGYIEDHSQN